LDTKYRKYSNSLNIAYDKLDGQYEEMAGLDLSQPKDAVRFKALEEEVKYSEGSIE
jgi:hypothetical protein